MNKRIRKKQLKNRIKRATKNLMLMAQAINTANTCPSRRWFGVDAAAPGADRTVEFVPPGSEKSHIEIAASRSHEENVTIANEALRMLGVQNETRK